MIHADLGHTYTDKITGFTGVAVSRTEYLTGCIHIGLEASEKDTKKSLIDYFDENRLDQVEGVQRITYERPANTTSPGEAPGTQHSHP